MSQRLDSDANRKRIEQAAQLARRGQYQRARFILQDIQQHPKAAALLKRIEGRDDRKDGAVLAFSGTILVIVGLGLVAVIAIIFFINTFQTQQDARGALFQEARDLGFEDVNLYVDLVTFCYNATSSGNPDCNGWAQGVYSDNRPLFRNCVFINLNGNIQIEEEDRPAAVTCLEEQGIPLPS